MDDNRNDGQDGAGEVTGAEPRSNGGEVPQPNNGRFRKNDPRIFKREKAVSQEEGAEIEAEPVPEEEGVPQQLLDMRHVYERPAYHDKTHRQKTCRAWLKDDLKAFMSAKTQLEGKLLSKQEAEAAKRRDGQPDGGKERDGGTQTALAALEKWMDNWHLEQAAEDAKLAARPDAARKSATLQNALTGSLEREAMLRAQVKDVRTTVSDLKGASRSQ
jgi:hypothetical protein